MQLNEEVQRHVVATYLHSAKKHGESTIRIRAGDVHRDLRWVNRVPSVCTTLGSKKFQRETGLELIAKEGPPSGMGTRVVFTYRLSSEKSVDDSSHKKSLFDGLYGIAADVFRELGGSEKFVRREREQLQFMTPDEQHNNGKRR
jgi:hypothetical protein